MKRQRAEGEGRIWERPETGCCVSEGFLANISTNAILVPLEGHNQVGKKPTRPQQEVIKPVFQHWPGELQQLVSQGETRAGGERLGLTDTEVEREPQPDI